MRTNDDDPGRRYRQWLFLLGYAALVAAPCLQRFSLSPWLAMVGYLTLLACAVDAISPTSLIVLATQSSIVATFCYPRLRPECEPSSGLCVNLIVILGDTATAFQELRESCNTADRLIRREKARCLLRVIAPPVIRLGSAGTAMACRLRHALQQRPFLQRRGKEGRPRRMGGIAAGLPNGDGVLPQYAVDCVGVNRPADVRPFAVVAERPE
jgi:hypothetical protein